jgi:hypothetical protein
MAASYLHIWVRASRCIYKTEQKSFHGKTGAVYSPIVSLTDF